MFALVDLSGEQIIVQEKNTYYIPKQEAEPGTELTFDSVLLTTDDSKTVVGAPFVKNASVKVKVLEHLKDDKVIVFKKKRRISYKKTVGHRQQYTKVEVTGIVAGKE